MTIGQRIAQKRKELGLSQEALGERLGVSRQAIYKWESDAALPEIEKLVNLSREFSVSIDWLLGEEDGAQEPRELTPEQLRMVEEIVGRYLDARPAQEAEAEEGAEKTEEQARKLKRDKRIKFWATFFAAAAAAYIFSTLFSRLDQIEQNYYNLRNSIEVVSRDVNGQVSSITSRVEQVLESQNTLTAERSAEVISTDCRANTVTVSARALPRTYVEGMEAEFILTSGGESVTVLGALGEDHAFTAEVTGPLSDSISVSAVFVTGNQRETQLLEQFTYLYSESFPRIEVESSVLWGTTGNIGEYTFTRPGKEAKGGAEVASVRVGLFQDQKLLVWYKPIEGTPPNWSGFKEGEAQFYQLEEVRVMEPGHVYCIAAVVVDTFGRERVYSSFPVKYDEERGFYEFYSVDGTIGYSADPAEWDY